MITEKKNQICGNGASFDFIIEKHKKVKKNFDMLTKPIKILQFIAFISNIKI